MKQLIIALLISTFTFIGGSSLSAITASAPALNSTSTVEEYIYVRVFENGQWWIYVYALDGSFIVVMPDEDED